jgi:hypothetical protein
MNILDRILPSTIFGRHMPWAHDTSKKAETPADPVPNEKDDLPETNPDVAPGAPPLDPSTSITDGLSKLKLEQFTKLEERAADLNEKAKALHTKIKDIDELLVLIQELCTAHPNKAIDCKDPRIQQITERLRNQGIRVPIPNGKLEANQVANLFTVLGNQRTLLSDEMKEHSTGFQQCATERNTLLQHFASIDASIHRSLSKISTNLASSRHG